jgi:hypothetical protein
LLFFYRARLLGKSKKENLRLEKTKQKNRMIKKAKLAAELAAAADLAANAETESDYTMSDSEDSTAGSEDSAGKSIMSANSLDWAANLEIDDTLENTSEVQVRVLVSVDDCPQKEANCPAQEHHPKEGLNAFVDDVAPFLYYSVQNSASVLVLEEESGLHVDVQDLYDSVQNSASGLVLEDETGGLHDDVQDFFLVGWERPCSLFPITQEDLNSIVQLLDSGNENESEADLIERLNNPNPNRLTV